MGVEVDQVVGVHVHNQDRFGDGVGADGGLVDDAELAQAADHEDEKRDEDFDESAARLAEQTACAE